MSPNLKAFLDSIAVSELGYVILKKSDNGYNVLVGSTPDDVRTFKGYADHPGIIVQVKQKTGNVIPSSAAGRYQIRLAIYSAYRLSLNLPDFSPASQDAIAVQLIKECKALDDVEAGRFDVAIFKCKSRWASLPGANYPGQHMNPIADLRAAFTKAGGVIA